MSYATRKITSRESSIHNKFVGFVVWQTEKERTRDKRRVRKISSWCLLTTILLSKLMSREYFYNMVYEYNVCMLVSVYPCIRYVLFGYYFVYISGYFTFSRSQWSWEWINAHVPLFCAHRFILCHNNGLKRKGVGIANTVHWRKRQRNGGLN